MLGACGTAPQRASDRVAAAGEPRATAGGRHAAAPVAAARRSRPGGYYKDDGPGDNPPPDLAGIPDAQPRAEPLHRFANEPYNVLGQDYTPSKQLVPFRQKGLASWYGRMFHGKKTSIGEPYDMYAMTAAHPTLPIPSYARVTNVGNGESVVVRVNDRGPFHPGRVIDLSYAAATRLGYVAKGHTLVEVESIIPDEASIAAARAATPPRRPLAKAPARPSAPVLPRPMCRTIRHRCGKPHRPTIRLPRWSRPAKRDSRFRRARPHPGTAAFSFSSASFVPATRPTVFATGSSAKLPGSPNGC